MAAVLTVVTLLFLWPVTLQLLPAAFIGAVCLLLTTMYGLIPIDTAAPGRLDFVFELFLVTLVH